MSVELVSIQCPYCGEEFEIEVEASPDEQSYIQDCEVCCHPIALTVVSGEDGVDVSATRSD